MTYQCPSSKSRTRMRGRRGGQGMQDPCIHHACTSRDIELVVCLCQAGPENSRPPKQYIQQVPIKGQLDYGGLHLPLLILVAQCSMRVLTHPCQLPIQLSLLFLCGEEERLKKDPSHLAMLRQHLDQVLIGRMAALSSFCQQYFDNTYLLLGCGNAKCSSTLRVLGIHQGLLHVFLLYCARNLEEHSCHLNRTRVGSRMQRTCCGSI
mmetsp:Transcript_7475/g.13398  ORF Transcript_7475/g.13398 Transcript_7475/m.13398 type:complete len:207 (+) Transcript_7475:1369-1989(+)